MDDGLVVGLVLVTLFLGSSTACIVLLYIPSLYRWLFARKCTRNNTQAEGAVIDVNGTCDETEVERGKHRKHYSEIDEQKTRTFQNKAHKVTHDNNIHPKSYENCVLDNKQTSYSDIDVAGKTSAPVVTSNPTAYEYVYMKTGNSESDEKPVNHIYSILEPGSCKRLPVKMLADDNETLKSDPNKLLYFVLKPGTNKVTPLFHNQQDERAQSLKRISGNTYFVLETNQCTVEAEAYAISDIGSNHDCFILESTAEEV